MMVDEDQCTNGVGCTDSGHSTRGGDFYNTAVMLRLMYTRMTTEMKIALFMCRNRNVSHINNLPTSSNTWAPKLRRFEDP